MARNLRKTDAQTENVRSLHADRGKEDQTLSRRIRTERTDARADPAVYRRIVRAGKRKKRKRTFFQFAERDHIRDPGKFKSGIPAGACSRICGRQDPAPEKPGKDD